MKVKVPGETPLERLTEFTRRIIAVQKTDLKKAAARRPKRKHKR